MSTRPKYFLGDTIEEAEKIHNRFVIVLNKIANNYSAYTGIDKGDLFSEGLFGLSDAVAKFDEKRSNDFYNFAVFKIKDSINNYVRKNKSHISIPKYINQSIILFNKITSILENSGIDEDYVEFIYEQKYYNCTNLKDSDVEEIEYLISNLRNIAERASTTIGVLIERINTIPQIVLSDAIELQYIQHDSHNSCIDNILSKLTEEESVISILLMDGYTQAEIAKKMNRSTSWVSNKIKDIRGKINEEE